MSQKWADQSEPVGGEWIPVGVFTSFGEIYVVWRLPDGSYRLEHIGMTPNPYADPEDKGGGNMGSDPSGGTDA